MPYSSISDPKLPKSVRKLSARKRRQWIATWNAVNKRTNDEGQAFTAANSAVKELAEDILVHSVKEFRIAT